MDDKACASMLYRDQLEPEPEPEPRAKSWLESSSTFVSESNFHLVGFQLM